MAERMQETARGAEQIGSLTAYWTALEGAFNSYLIHQKMKWARHACLAFLNRALTTIPPPV
jgi:hypothetical protein